MVDARIASTCPVCQYRGRQLLSRTVIGLVTFDRDERSDRLIGIKAPHLVGILRGEHDTAYGIRFRLAAQRVDRTVNAVGRTNRRRGPQLHDDVRPPPNLGREPIEGVLKHRKIGRQVLGQRGWSQERHLRTIPARDRRNLLIIGRDDDAVDRPRGQSRFDAVGNERNTAEQLDVLSRNRLRAAARGHNRNSTHGSRGPTPALAAGAPPYS